MPANGCKDEGCALAGPPIDIVEKELARPSAENGAPYVLGATVP